MNNRNRKESPNGNEDNTFREVWGKKKRGERKERQKERERFAALLALQVNLMCRSGEICKYIFIHLWLKSLSPSLTLSDRRFVMFCLFFSSTYTEIFPHCLSCMFSHACKLTLLTWSRIHVLTHTPSRFDRHSNFTTNTWGWDIRFSD